MIKKNTEALGEIKAQIFSLKGQTCEFCINRGRKRFDRFSAVIDNTYPSVFTILYNEKIQTFSYFDVLCGTVRINTKSL